MISTDAERLQPNNELIRVFPDAEIRCNPEEVMKRIGEQLQNGEMNLTTVLCVPKDNHGWADRLMTAHKSTRQLCEIVTTAEALLHMGFNLRWKVILGDVCDVAGSFMTSTNIESIKEALDPELLATAFRHPSYSAASLVTKYQSFVGNIPGLEMSSATEELVNILQTEPGLIVDWVSLAEGKVDSFWCIEGWEEKLVKSARLRGGRLPMPALIDFSGRNVGRSKPDLEAWAVSSLELMGSVKMRAMVSALFPSGSILLAAQEREVNDRFHITDRGESFPTISVFKNLSSLED